LSASVPLFRSGRALYPLRLLPGSRVPSL